VQALWATRAVRPPQNGSAWRDCNRQARSDATALSGVLRRRSSQPVVQWDAGREREPRLRRAAVRIHAANAVRVAGPDRIFFGLWALGSGL
jgi:hypothetical protein